MGRINKFLCEYYPEDDNGDISLYTFLWVNVIAIIVVALILAAFGVGITILGFTVQSAFNGGMWIPEDEISLMTPIYGFVALVAALLFCEVVDQILSINIAHCPKEKVSPTGKSKIIYLGERPCLIPQDANLGTYKEGNK